MNFTGFTLPDGAWLPPEIIYLIPYLSEAELKCVVVALYHYMQIGSADSLSLSDFERLTGLSRPSVTQALSSLTGRTPLKSNKAVQVFNRLPLDNSFVYEPVVKIIYQQAEIGELPSKNSLLGAKKSLLPSKGTPGKESLPGQTVKLVKVNYPESEEGSSTLATQLRQLGVSAKPLAELLQKFPPEYIQEKLAFYAYARKVGFASGAGWFVSACRYNWGAPSGYVEGVHVEMVQPEDEEEVPAFVAPAVYITETGPHFEPAVPEKTDVPPEASKSWEWTLWTMFNEMPRSQYQARLEPMRLIGYQNGGATATFTIATPDAEARQWAEERLTAYMQRLLSGAHNIDAQIKFVLQEPAHV